MKTGKCNIKSQASQFNASTRETREKWPLLTVETEINGYSNRTNERGPFLVRWACHAGTRDFCSALATLVGPVQNFNFNSSVPILPSKLGAGSRAGSPVFQCVSLT